MRRGAQDRPARPDRLRLDGTVDQDVTFPAGPERTRTMKGFAYLTQWMLPNLYFHVTTAYAILRKDGVEVGKLDYLLGDQPRS